MAGKVLVDEVKTRLCIDAVAIVDAKCLKSRGVLIQVSYFVETGIVPQSYRVKAAIMCRSCVGLVQ